MLELRQFGVEDSVIEKGGGYGGRTTRGKSTEKSKSRRDTLISASRRRVLAGFALQLQLLMLWLVPRTRMLPLILRSEFDSIKMI